MSIKRKALRNENRATRNKGGRINISLKERLLRGLLAIGFTMAPWAMPSAYADIVRVDGGNFCCFCSALLCRHLEVVSKSS